MASPNKTRVQVATDPAFSNVVHDVEGAYTTALQIAEEVLPQGVNLYARGMHGHPTTGDSSWSTTVQFQIKLAWSDWDGSANGLEYSLNSSNSYYISAVSLSNTKVLVCYCDGTTNSHLYAIVLTINDSIITASIPIQCNDTYTNYISVVTLSENKAIICYRNYSDNDYLYSVVLTIAGNEITTGIPFKCNNTYSIYISAVALSENKIVVCYRNHSASYRLYAMVIMINGTVITAGTPIQCNITSSYYISAVALSDTKVLVSYCNGGANNYLYTVLLTIDGVTITANAQTLCANVIVKFISSVLISENKVLVCYRNDNNQYSLYAVVLTIFDGVVSVGTPVQCHPNAAAAYISAVLVAENKVLICYRSGYLHATLVEVNDTTVTPLMVKRCNDDVNTGGWSDYDISATKVGNNVFVAYNKDDNTTLYGKVLVG